ncbi:universal stress protein [Rothia sp. AR01]|uniref:Universal stress protein n=1 Tax=Rothia santali TaxID=2949643 RepID=A0A9X2KLN6_9MICC|nr:universal stress protein [Rothia santali]MCP3426356.1 universal stress protein [Rothia santali]
MTIVLASADSPAGQAARDYAVAEAKRRDADLVVFPVDGSSPDPAQFDYDRVSVQTPDERSKDAVGDLIDMTSRDDVEVVVVGVRRRSPVGKMFLGSSAQQIILEAAAPVITVKPTQGEG